MSDLRIKLILEAIDRVSAPLRRLGENVARSAERMRASLRGLSNGLGEVGRFSSLTVSAPLAAFGAMAVRQSASFDALRASLKTATGSAGAAREAFDRLNRFAATTPFQLEEVLGAYVRLKNLGLDPSIEALSSYGNTASAMGKSLDQYIEAVADAATGEFERLKEFGIRARANGESVAFTFRGVTTQVGNNAAAIEGYLRDLGRVQFAGAMQAQMETLGGAFSNLKDAVSSAMARVGDRIAATLELGAFTARLTRSINALADAFVNLPEPVQSFIIKAGLLLALLGPLLVALGQFALGLSFVILGFSKLGPLATLVSALATRLLIPALLAMAGAAKAFGVALLTTPLGWILAGLAALAGAAYLIVKHWEPISAFFKSLWKDVEEIFTRSVQYVMGALQPLFNTLDRVGDALSRIRSMAVDNALTRSVSGWFAPGEEQAATGPAAPLGLGPAATLPGGGLRRSMDAGGTLRIRIDSDGQARAVDSRPNDPRMGYAVETGLLMGGM